MTGLGGKMVSMYSFVHVHEKFSFVEVTRLISPYN